MSISIYLADVVRLTGHTPHPPAEEPSSAWISPANCDFQPAAATWKLSPHLTGQCHDWRALRNLGRGSGSPQWTSHLASGMLAKKAAKSSRYSDALSPSHPRTICASVLLDCQGWGRFPCPGALQVLKLEMRNGCIIDFAFFCLRFWILLLLSFLVPFALYLQQLGTRTSHFAWYLLHFGWSLCILHGTCYIWPCSPSILHDICHIMALQLLMCMVFATFWYFKRSCGFLESSSGFL